MSATQSFPPPKGTPVATGARGATASPSAQPGKAAQTRDADAPDVGRRFLVPSVSLLKASRLLAALACVIAGVVGAWVLNGASASLDAINDGNQQVLRLQQIKGDVLRADGAATNGLAQGASDPTGQTQDYRTVLADAAKLTVDASKAQPLDQGDLAAVNAGLVNYVLTMERARTAYPANNATGLESVTAAGTTLRNDTIPALDKLIGANQARVDVARASDRLWAAGLALVPVLILLGLSIWLARRTRRVLNIGLLLALAASVLLWRLVDTNLADTASMVDAAKAGSLQKATAAANAYSSLADARSWEGRELLQPSAAATNEASWTTAIGQVDAAIAKLQLDSAKAQVDAYKTAHASVATQLKANKVTEARTAASATTAGSLNPAYKAAADALTTAFNDNRKAVAAEVSKLQDGLLVATGLALLLGLIGGLASWIGISQRLGEYR